MECYISAMRVSNYNQKDITPIVFAKADKMQGVTLQNQLLVLLDSGSISTLIKRTCFPFGFTPKEGIVKTTTTTNGTYVSNQ